MTNQLQGEILYAGIDSSNGDYIYTPWMPVRGDQATFGVEVVRRNSVTLTWNVETRTADDPSSVAPLWASDRTTTATDVQTSGAVLADQWVRYRFATNGSASTANYVVFRALQPSWLVNDEAPWLSAPRW